MILSAFFAMSHASSSKTIPPARRMLNLLLLVGMLVLFIYILKAGANTLYRHFYPRDYSDLVEKYSAENGLDEVFVYSVISCESGFDPEARSSVGALGLMQITEDAFEWVMFRKGETRDLTFDMLTDPALNIEYGTYMLGFFQNEFGSAENVLCAYHAGRGQTQKWLADDRYTTDGVITNIPFSDTASYVAKVKKTMDIYKNLYYGGK